MRARSAIFAALLAIASQPIGARAQSGAIPEEASFVLPIDERGRVEVDVTWSRVDRSCTARVSYDLADVVTLRSIPEPEEVLDAIEPILGRWDPEACSVITPGKADSAGPESIRGIVYSEFRRSGGAWERIDASESVGMGCFSNVSSEDELEIEVE